MAAKQRQVDDYTKKAAQFRLDVERYNYVEQLQFNWDYKIEWYKKWESFFLALFDSPNRYEANLPSKTGRLN